LKKWILPLLLFVAVCGAGYGSYRVHRYRQWKAAFGDAFYAYRRAYEFRDAENLLYLQRLKNFETTMGALDRLPPFNDHASTAREELRARAEEMDLYRRWTRLNSASMSLGTGTDLQGQANAEREAGSCVRSAAIEGDLH
jgi:hypothetical protein